MKNQIQILSSELLSLVESLYLLTIAYVQEGKPDPETASRIKEAAPKAIKKWGEQLPSLKAAFQAALKAEGEDEVLATLGEEMRTSFGEFKANHTFTDEELDLYKAFARWFKSSVESAFKYIEKHAGLTHNEFIAKQFMPKVASQQPIIKALQAFNKKHVGKPLTSLDIETAAKLRAKSPEIYKEYLELRRQYSQSWKNALTTFVRSSGKPMVPFQALEKFFKSKNIEHGLPTGFTGLIDDQGRWYTKEGKLINGVPSAVMFPTVKMNDTGRGPWVFKPYKEDGTAGNYFYTVEDVRKNAREKFTKVADITGKMPAIRKKWLSLLRNFSINDPKTVAALELELLYEFSARIGSMGNSAGGQATQGISTLQVKNVYPQGNGNLVLRYLGKDGVKTKHVLMKNNVIHRQMIKGLELLCANKTAKDYIFTYKSGSRDIRVPGSMVNKLFQALGAENITVHKIRTFHGTVLFKELSEKYLSQEMNEAKAKQVFNAIAEAVGKKLNHVRRGSGGDRVTGSTALASYIDPGAQIRFWTALGHRPPKAVLKRAGINE